MCISLQNPGDTEHQAEDLSHLQNRFCYLLTAGKRLALSRPLYKGPQCQHCCTDRLSPLLFQCRGRTHGHFYRHRCHAGHDACGEEGGRLRLCEPDPGSALPDGTDRCKCAAAVSSGLCSLELDFGTQPAAKPTCRSSIILPFGRMLYQVSLLLGPALFNPLHRIV